MGKKTEGKAESARSEGQYLGLHEIEDVLAQTEAALGNLEIITRTMKQQAQDGFDGIKNDATRHAYYKLADLAEEALESLEEVHDTLNTAYKAA